MGEINIQIELENASDRYRFEVGELEESEIRRHSMQALVDTEAVMLVLPQDVVEKLGLRVRRKVIVRYANESKEERPVAGPVEIHIGERFMDMECIVGPPTSEALIGQVVLETLDLLADCVDRTLVPRPESPIYPMLKLK